MRMCPAADPTDGLLDVVVAGPISPDHAAAAQAEGVRGHPRDPPGGAPATGPGRSSIDAPSGITAYADGERTCPLPMTVTAVPGALRCSLARSTVALDGRAVAASGRARRRAARPLRGARRRWPAGPAPRQPASTAPGVGRVSPTISVALRLDAERRAGVPEDRRVGLAAADLVRQHPTRRRSSAKPERGAERPDVEADVADHRRPAPRPRRSACSVGSGVGVRPPALRAQQPLVQRLGEPVDAGVDGRGQPGVRGPVRVGVQVPVGPDLGQVRRHPGRARPAGPAGGDEPVGQRRWPAARSRRGAAGGGGREHPVDRVLDLRDACRGSRTAPRRRPLAATRCGQAVTVLAARRARIPSGANRRTDSLSSLVCMTSPAERYARPAGGGRGSPPALTEFAAELAVRARPVPARGLRGAGAGQRRAGVRADRGRQDRGRRVRRAPGAGRRGRKCFYTTPIKALSNQKYNDLVDRYGAGQGRPAHRGQLDQRRRAGGGDDHRGAAQHALRRLAGPATASATW